ncbi:MULTISPECIES: (-)-alpha-amorphene synthase [unclassified Streptomyces]|uniref:(-)-alpha-amorphene synthase n=1 Tax=unclassified Streptomyces TaxID=2593676 RepID=UPI000D19BE91|nr:(-)-alpha-amorphene synthase [Streptomyces sp. CB02400]
MTTLSTTHEDITAGTLRGIPGSDLRDLIDTHLHMPFPFRTNPHEHRVTAGVEKWLRKTGLADESWVPEMIARTRPAQLASYNGPEMDSGLLQIVANQIAYQFVFDDRAEEVGRQGPGRLLPMLDESIAVLRDDASPSTPLGAALADLHRQVRERCTPAQAARWAVKSREYVHGLLYEAVAQADTAPLPTGLCTSIRSLTAGVEPFHPLCEAAQPCELSDAELHHPVMRRLTRLSADAAVWIPDLYSAVKERQAGGMINLALAHQRAHRCSLPVAVMLAIRQINRTIDEFVGLFEEIRPRLSPSAVGYAEGMAGWIRGCCHWSRTVPRYADTAAAPA